MGPKKIKSGKKSKHKKTSNEINDVSAVERTFYELTIIDLNNKLSRLRNLIRNLEYNKNELNEKVRQLDEDRNDISAYLQRQLTEKISVTQSITEKLFQLEKERDEENKIYKGIINEWEKKYKAMNEQLISEIRLLNAKLRSLEEFRLERTNLLMKFDEQENELKELKQLQKAKLYEMEQRLIFEKDKLKKDIEVKLLEFSDDFTKSNEIRIGGYTRRLIRENIALNNEMDRIMKLQICMEQSNKKMIYQLLQMKHLYTNSTGIKEKLLRTCENHIETIKNLTIKYELLLNKYHRLRRHKKFYDISVQNYICNTFTYNEMAKKLINMRHRIENLKVEKIKYILMHHQYETEITHLHNLIKEIKLTVQSAVRGELEKSDETEFRTAQKIVFLEDILKIITMYFDRITAKSSVNTISDINSLYQTEYIDLTTKVTDSICGEKKTTSGESNFPVVKMKSDTKKITPQVYLEREILLDVESDSTIIFSLDSGEELKTSEKYALEEQEENSTSTSSTSQKSGTSKTKLAHKIDKKKNKHIVKIEKYQVGEEYEEEEKVTYENKLHKAAIATEISKSEEEDNIRYSENNGESNEELQNTSVFRGITDYEEDELDYSFY